MEKARNTKQEINNTNLLGLARFPFTNPLLSSTVFPNFHQLVESIEFRGLAHNRLKCKNPFCRECSYMLSLAQKDIVFHTFIAHCKFQFI